MPYFTVLRSNFRKIGAVMTIGHDENEPHKVADIRAFTISISCVEANCIGKMRLLYFGLNIYSESAFFKIAAVPDLKN
jgi:hypothetical protein